MRHFLLSAGLAVLCWALPAPAFAQQASDCGLICSITGYLSSDHMAAAPGGTAAPGGPAKSRRTHAANHKAPAAVKAKTVLAKGPKVAPLSKLAAKPARPSLAAAAPAAPAGNARRVAAIRPPVDPIKPGVVRRTMRPNVAERRVQPAIASPRQAKAAEVKPETLVAADRKPRSPSRAARAMPMASHPARGTRTAWALIPGSAPMMAAGFQPFRASTLH